MNRWRKRCPCCLGRWEGRADWNACHEHAILRIMSPRAGGVTAKRAASERSTMVVRGWRKSHSAPQMAAGPHRRRETAVRVGYIVFYC